ncbi:hypothetical protein [Dyadobacter luticola]|uniref:Uncharacterized protein n=1 Tax=Dyadobacter luticola TaxID=1979387 RepID=A0A5R9KX01_9BACT|nr:hypothetical protein [Dyadobacter luticola]TLV00668.1 hypothetical protein FEN17_14390 [Dyadobacter luticola]
MSKSTAIELPAIPKDKDYEDYVCAFMQAGGLYVERSIIHREVEELLELDILTTDFQPDSATNNLVEIKGGDWGFSDLFKICGWMTYLNYDHACFIVQKTRPSIKFFRDKAKELKIDLIDNSDLSSTHETLKSFLHINPSKEDIETIRFSYLLERKQLALIKKLKKSNPTIVGYSLLDDYFYKINSGSFFVRNPIKRINQLFKYFIEYKNISAKICRELNGGNFHDQDVVELSKKCFEETFYNPSNTIIQVSLYIEHLARVTILKCAIEHIIEKSKGNYNGEDITNILSFLSLPRTIKSALLEISNDPYFFLYPRFWQFFTYVFGGFILTDIESKEYAILAEKTGIPEAEIPNAFNAFNKLFPKQNGWFFKIPNSSINWHNFFPIAFSGIGANYRRMIYASDQDYDELFKDLSGSKTSSDLTKWNNLAHSILK